MTPEERAKILDRVRKCLALAKGSTSSGEAAAAMHHAQKLMEKYGLTETDAMTAQIKEERVKSTTSVTRPKHWELALVQIACKAFGCRALWQDGNSQLRRLATYILLGGEDQLALARYTIAVLLRQVRRARVEYMEQQQFKYRMTRSEQTCEADSFCLGWVIAVEKTVHAFAGSDEYKNALDLYHRQKCAPGKPAKALARREFSDAALGDGHAAGKGVLLQRPVTGAETAALTHSKEM